MQRHQWWVIALAGQRLGELVWSRRNERRMTAAGGRRCDRDRYTEMVMFHAVWLAALSAVAKRRESFAPRPVAAMVVGQALRYWCIRSLGDRWTTRVVVVPGRPLVIDGPYRWMRHPNYLAVAIEIAAGPLILRRRSLAFAATLVNGAIVARRIGVEEACLRGEHHHAAGVAEVSGEAAKQDQLRKRGSGR